MGSSGDWRGGTGVRRAPCARLVQADGGAYLFELAGEGADQRLLEVARRAGLVRHFSSVRPTLAELFRWYAGPAAHR